jgi:hypothetical protein
MRRRRRWVLRPKRRTEKQKMAKLSDSSARIHLIFHQHRNAQASPVSSP